MSFQWLLIAFSRLYDYGLDSIILLCTIYTLLDRLDILHKDLGEQSPLPAYEQS